MLAVLDKVTIKSEILPYLSTVKRGFETKSCLIEIINAILYKLKTGCQWEHLSIEALVTTTVLSHGADRFRKRIETIFSQLNDNLMMIRNYAKQSRGLFTHTAGKIAAMPIMQSVKFVNHRPVGLIKYSLI